MLTSSKVAVVFDVDARTINRWCKEGKFSTAQKIGGTEEGGGTWYVSEDDPLLLRMSPQKGNEEKVEENAKPESKSPEAQSIKDEIAKIQAETGKINAEINKEEALGRRDKPAKLAEKEVALNNRETAITNKEVASDTREAEIAARLKDLETKETLLKIRQTEADAYYNRKVHEGDALYNSKKSAADLMEETLKDLVKQINILDEKLAQYPAKLKPILDELTMLIGRSNQWGTHYYRKAQNAQGQESDYHTRKSNRFFGLADAFAKIKDWIGG